MIRFPNPGSDVQAFVRIFQTLYSFLNGKPWFNLDDMSATLTRMNLAASSGYIGEQALALSTRSDRSRDPLYNQSKMYAELFRTIGWMVSDDPDNALKFRFTLLGDHAAVANIDPKAIFEVSILGINYPNSILAVKGNEASRPFSTILKVTPKLDYHICRDELIIGVLNRDDTGDSAIDDIVSSIRNLRGSNDRLLTAKSELSRALNIQENTMENYTRFPLAVLTYCGWFERIRTKEFYPNAKPKVMLKLTPYGKEISDELSQMEDIRLSDYEKQPATKQQALIRVGFFQMLHHANFDISPVAYQLEKDEITIFDVVKGGRLLFSPYQTVRPEIVDETLGYVCDKQDEINQEINTFIKNGNVKSQPQIVTTIKLRHLDAHETPIIGDSNIQKTIAQNICDGHPDDKIAMDLFQKYHNVTKEVFYPLIANLFTIIGFQCRVSRAGINYERWDAIVEDDNYSIPIEIKSPTEELNVSIKAVRQALENKVILLSRNSYETDWDTVTLAVGYNPPNERAEVSRLIQEIKTTFNIKIGVIDFLSLLKLAIVITHGQKKINLDDIRKMQGLIDVENF